MALVYESLRSTLHTWLVLALAASSCILCPTVGRCAAGLDPRTWQSFLQSQVEKNRPIRFAGIVQDLAGNPIGDAAIKLSVEKNVLEAPHRSMQDFHVRTGTDGTFSFANEEGVTLYVRSIEKDGFEFKKVEGVPTTFHFVGAGVFHGPSILVKEWPVPFKMRKVAKSAALLSRRYLEVLETMKEAHMTVDLVDDVVRRDGREGDLMFKARRNTKTGALTIEISALGEDAGLVVLTPQEPYVAPLHGYNRAQLIEVVRENRAKKDWRYFIVRSRRLPIYSRCELRVSDDGERTSIQLRCQVNPFGGIELEMSPNVPYEQLKDAEESLRRSVRNGRPPVSE